MNKRSLINLALLIVVAALAAGAWLLPQDAKPAKPLLLNLPLNSLTVIEIKKPETPLVRLEKQNGQWRMILPRPTAVDAKVMQEFLKALHAKVQASYPAKDIDPDAIGLTTPQLIITVNGAARLVFGGITPVHYQRYVKVGDAIKVIDGVDYYPLAVTADSLAAKQETPHPNLLPEGEKG